MCSYTQNGILHMLDRNKRIKPRPERFQNCKDLFDLILTCEERVYDQVVEGEPADPAPPPVPGPCGLLCPACLSHTCPPPASVGQAAARKGPGLGLWLTVFSWARPLVLPAAWWGLEGLGT